MSGHPQLIPSGLSKKFERVTSKQARKKKKKKEMKRKTTWGLSMCRSTVCCFCHFDVVDNTHKNRENTKIINKKGEAFLKGLLEHLKV